MNERNRPPLAVALHYSGSGAPRVVAKGGGLVAERIVETAREHNVPLQQDSALAAALVAHRSRTRDSARAVRRSRARARLRVARCGEERTYVRL